jgi:endonuclease/exonuclease/phosphatase family metal-dependent hydrolase
MPKHYMRNRDPGCAAFAVLDTTSRFGRPVTIWMLDLPSNPRFSRLSIARLTRQHIARAGAAEPSRSFPDPDIIAGDLNIPAHSASLRVLAPGMTDSAAQAGVGYIATWPRRRPVYQLDHVMLAPWLRADRYRVIDPGMAEHRMEWVEVAPR